MLSKVIILILSLSVLIKGEILQVKNSAEFKTALSKLSQGDVISLAKGVYSGNFLIKIQEKIDNSQLTSFIFIKGNQNVIFENKNKSEPVIEIINIPFIKLYGFKIQNSEIGLSIKDSGVIIENFLFENLGKTGVEIDNQDMAVNNSVKVTMSTFKNIGTKKDTFGRGIHILKLKEKIDFATYRQNNFFSKLFTAVSCNFGPRINGIGIENNHLYTDSYITSNSFMGWEKVAKNPSNKGCWVYSGGLSNYVTYNFGEGCNENGFTFPTPEFNSKEDKYCELTFASNACYNEDAIDSKEATKSCVHASPNCGYHIYTSNLFDPGWNLTNLSPPKQ